MIDEIIKAARELVNLPKNVRDTAYAISRGDLAGAAQSYAKTVPAAAVISKAAIPVTTKLTSIFSSSLSGKIASNTLLQSGQALSKTAKWWLVPAKSAGVATKQAGTAAVKKFGISALGKVGVAAAVVGGEHLLSKMANSVSTITYVSGFFDKKTRDEVLDGPKPQNFGQKLVDFSIAGPQRRFILKLIRKTEGGKKK